MDIRPLRTEADYDAALAAIEALFDDEPGPGSPEADAFDLLALVIADYERRHWPIDPPDPVDAIRYRMETGGFSQADLGRLLGSRQRASDILNRKPADPADGKEAPPRMGRAGGSASRPRRGAAAWLNGSLAGSGPGAGGDRYLFLAEERHGVKGSALVGRRETRPP
jgi:antitoxin component HigA of HigAB toxin-antitoxin module